MKFIFESESTINSYEPDYAIDYERDIEDTEIDLEPNAVALDLLSIEEVENLPATIGKYDEYWWLRSPGFKPYNAVVVNFFNEAYYGRCNVFKGDYCVRPALTLENIDSSNLKLYASYKIDSDEWVYIGDNRFLYDDMAIKHRFDKGSNDYKSSEIKGFLDDWLKELQTEDLTIEEA